MSTAFTGTLKRQRGRQRRYGNSNRYRFGNNILMVSRSWIVNVRGAFKIFSSPFIKIIFMFYKSCVSFRIASESSKTAVLKLLQTTKVTVSPHHMSHSQQKENVSLEMQLKISSPQTPRTQSLTQND